MTQIGTVKVHGISGRVTVPVWSLATLDATARNPTGFYPDEVVPTYVRVRTAGGVTGALRLDRGLLLRAAYAPGPPAGIGGDDAVIWYCDTDRLYELSIADLSVMRSTPLPTYEPMGWAIATGVGGDSSAIWYCSGWPVDDPSTPGAPLVRQFDPDDLSIVQTVDAPTGNPTGIGGTSAVVWYSDNALNRIFELSPADLSVVRSGPAPDTNITAIGGNSEVIWCCDGISYMLYRLDPSDFSILASTRCPGMPGGIGGTPNSLWWCDERDQIVCELFSGLGYQATGVQVRSWVGTRRIYGEPL